MTECAQQRNQGPPWWFSGKERLPLNEMGVQSLAWEDPLEKEMATHSNILAWEILWIEAPGRLQFIGLQRVEHNRARVYSEI